MTSPISIRRDPAHCSYCARPGGHHVSVEAAGTPLRLTVHPPEGGSPALVGGVYDLGVPDAISAALIAALFGAAAEVAASLDAAAGTGGRRYTRSKVNRWR